VSCSVSEIPQADCHAYHLMSKHWELVHLHCTLVLSIDALVCDQACCSDHIGSHTVACKILDCCSYGLEIKHTDEQNHILSTLLLLKWAYDPIGNSLGAVVVAESCSVLSWLVQRNSSVCLGSDANDRWSLGILCEKILIPGEVPAFESWFGKLEEACCWLSCPTSFGDCEAEVWIWDATICLGPIDWSMDLLPCQKMAQSKANWLHKPPIECQNIVQRENRSDQEEGHSPELHGGVSTAGKLGESWYSLGHPPRRWNVCAAVNETIDETAKAILDTETMAVGGRKDSVTAD